ncbi:HNH endonuclease family protein [Mycolicibacter sp. MYC123]|uniref:HNH endonuclease family protein n=1 Tax=[Mycobacterium] zoologicum TaxID=2872311 RepID=A0ABU5YI06_9MYCO|nr:MULTISPECIES: HNH endonuclease family protein [unclassified Mycolicibacter]MEB3049686.1 HNH endonuclease family protein [Mycolicibacter sp. MYC123]MEB3063437.1 HNH endonuclease family protein [Mycolicibacter sp. MYC101]
MTNRKALVWLAVAAVLAVIVAYQTVSAVVRSNHTAAAMAGMPTVAAGTDVLAGITVVPVRTHRFDYRRSVFGDAWDDDNDAPGGHNGCDTRDDILNRDLVDITHVWTKRCPEAVATGTLHDPYTNATVSFTRGAKIGEAVQIDHIVPLSYAWDMGASAWPYRQRLRFANDPANLLAVAGQGNQDKGDAGPGQWMPPNKSFACQYAVAYIAVVRGYGLRLDQPSAEELRRASATCPTG